MNDAELPACSVRAARPAQSNCCVQMRYRALGVRAVANRATPRYAYHQRGDQVPRPEPQRHRAGVVSSHAVGSSLPSDYKPTEPSGCKQYIRGLYAKLRQRVAPKRAAVGCATCWAVRGVLDQELRLRLWLWLWHWPVRRSSSSGTTQWTNSWGQGMNGRRASHLSIATSAVGERGRG